MKKSEIAIDIVVFAGTVAFAAYQNWTAKDIIWSLWISSLVMGFSFIIFSSLTIFLYDNIRLAGTIKNSKKSSLSNTPPLFFNFNIIVLALVLIRWSSPVKWLIIIGSIFFAALSILLKDRSPDRGGPVLQNSVRRALWRFFTYLPMVVFILGFFTVHFGFFHFIHSIFLNGFFPIIEVSPFGKTPDEIVVFFSDLIGRALGEYWPFIVFSAFSRINDYGKALRKPGGPHMGLPYVNVVRMHLMIFVFAALYALRLQSYAVYPVLFFYFFPFGPIVKVIFPRKKRDTNTSK